MKLSLQGIEDKQVWEEKGYHLPQYDIKRMVNNTKENLSGFILAQGTCSVRFMQMLSRIC